MTTEAAVLEIFGELTVRGARAEREALLEVDAVGWQEFRDAAVALLRTDPPARRVLVADLPEPTRRRLVLVLTDESFLIDLLLRRLSPRKGTP